MVETIAIHENDPTFPIGAIEHARVFVNDPDVMANPEKHAQLVREMFIEGAIIENHSPYAEVHALVDNTDDPTLPSSTIRMWTIGIVDVIIGPFINQLFSIRQPKIEIGANVAHILASEYQFSLLVHRLTIADPVGKAWRDGCLIGASCLVNAFRSTRVLLTRRNTCFSRLW